MPSRDGSNSFSSVNSLLQILSTILRGIGGEHGPTVMASVELQSLLTGETRGTIDHTVDVDRLLLLDVTFTSKLLPEDPELPSNVFAPLNAAEPGTAPIVGCWCGGT